MNANPAQPRAPRSTRWIVLPVIVLSTLFLAACTIQPVMLGTRDVVTRELDFAGFDEVEITSAFIVQIHQGDEFRIMVEIDEASLEYLDVAQSGDRLRLSLRPRRGIFWNLEPVHRAQITMPTLVGLSVDDASHVTVEGFQTDAAVYFEVTDASTLEGEIDTGDTTINVDDASTLRLTGNRGDVEMEVDDSSRATLVGEGRNVTVRVTDASTANLTDFRVQDANLQAHDASSITIDVAGRLDAEADNASSIVYYGSPTIGNTRSSDASSITARER